MIDNGSRTYATFVAGEIEPQQRFYITDVGTAILKFHDYDNLNIHLDASKADLFLQWAINVHRALATWNEDYGDGAGD